MNVFSAAVRGRLEYTPFQVLRKGSSLLCAIECLSFKPVLCQSFNYDYGDSRRCELVRAVAGSRIHVHRVSFTSKKFNRVSRVMKGSSSDHKNLKLILV